MTRAKKTLISIVIPTKNEEKNLKSLFPKLKSYGDEILVVDGYSKDKTRQVAKKFGARVILDNGKGKGAALRKAIRAVKGKVIVFIDADHSANPADIPRLIRPILSGKADHVSGSRMLAGSDELFSNFGQFIKLVGSYIITLGINYRFNVRLTDTQNGFRAIKTRVARQLNLEENITTIEQEMIIKTLKKGYRLIEVPTHEYARKHGQSTIFLPKVAARYVYCWLKYLFFA